MGTSESAVVVDDVVVDDAVLSSSTLKRRDDDVVHPSLLDTRKDFWMREDANAVRRSASDGVLLQTNMRANIIIVIYIK